MASSAVCVLVYQGASASIQTLWQAAVVLLHPSGVELRVCACVCVSVFSMCVCISENVTAYQRAMCVSTDMWEQCECVRWLSPAIVKATASNHIRERVGDRMTRPGTSQRLPAATHRHRHTLAHQHTHTHTHTHPDTHSYSHIYHTYQSTYWHTLSHALSLSLSLSLSVALSLSLSLSLSLPTHTHTC